MDEDALLGIGSEDEFDVDYLTQKSTVSGEEFATANDTIEEDEIIQLGVDDGDDLDE